jgi:hypothetical protein
VTDRYGHAAAVLAGCVLAAWLAPASASSQTAGSKGRAFTPPRTADSHPDFQGVWGAQPVGSYNLQDLEFQSIYQDNRPDPRLRGQSRVVDPPNGKIPYQAWTAPTLAKRLLAHLDPTPDTLDPSARCFLQGVPRHIMNREFEIWQLHGSVVFFNMAHHTSRVVALDGRPALPPTIKLWMGDSHGRWEGDTLVIETTNQNDQTWLDIVGDFHSEALQVVERLTMVGPDSLDYEATLTDPNVYTRPWTMRTRLERDRNYGELWEEACFEGNARVLKGMLARPGR